MIIKRAAPPGPATSNLERPLDAAFSPPPHPQLPPLAQRQLRRLDNQQDHHPTPRQRLRREPPPELEGHSALRQEQRAGVAGECGRLAADARLLESPPDGERAHHQVDTQPADERLHRRGPGQEVGASGRSTVAHRIVAASIGTTPSRSVSTRSSTSIVTKTAKLEVL